MNDPNDLLAEGLLSVVAAAKFLGVSRSTVWGLMRDNQLPYTTFGRHRRIPVVALKGLALKRMQFAI